MKNYFLLIIAALAIVFLAKEGEKQAMNSGDPSVDPSNFVENLKRGFKSTFKSLYPKESNGQQPSSQQVDDSFVKVWENDMPANEDMVFGQPLVSSFRGLSHPKKRGMFHKSVLASRN